MSDPSVVPEGIVSAADAAMLHQRLSEMVRRVVADARTMPEGVAGLTAEVVLRNPAGGKGYALTVGIDLLDGTEDNNDG